MATTGPYATRVVEVAHATSLGGAYSDVERVENGVYRGSTGTADTSNNDDNGWESHVPTWKTGELSFDVIAAHDATNLQALWTAFLAGTQLFYKFRPSGVSASDYQYRQQGTITSIEDSAQKRDAGRYRVTVQMTGALTRDTQ